MRNHAIHALFVAATLLAPCTGSSAQVVPTALDRVNITPPNYKVPHFLEGDHDTIAAAHITLLDLLTIEYPYSPDHIIGLTPEQRNTRFDVVAKIDPPGVSDPEHDPRAYKFMIDALLKNHFRLVVHETDKPFEQLMVASDATKPGPCPPAGSPSTIVSECLTMDEFAARLSNEVHVDVVNRTNLSGTFAIGFNWLSGLIVPPPAAGRLPRLPQSLRTGLRASLGLMLMPGQNQNKNLVVDHVEFPVILELTRTATAD
jgi:uncharacterized protein (TIGR03435 family)